MFQVSMFAKGMFESRQAHSLVLEPAFSEVDDKLPFRSTGSKSPSDTGSIGQIGCSLQKTANEAPKSRLGKDGCSRDRAPSGKCINLFETFFCDGKNGRASLGDSIYRSITVDFFDPQQFLSALDLSTEHKILDLKNRIEASVIIWQRKMLNKDGKSSWGSAVSLEKREQFEERAKTILLLLKQRFPGIPQSALDISKIQYNRDVGHSVIESYSRILESLAFTVLSRIDDVLYADSLARDPSLAHQNNSPSSGTVKPLNTGEGIQINSMEGGGNAMTLSDFMGWQFDQETDINKQDHTGNPQDMMRKDDAKLFVKPANVVTNKKVSYIEKLENLGGLRSPTSRH